MDTGLFHTIGLAARDVILGLANLLREDWTPGAVSIGLVAMAVLTMVLLLFRDWQRRRALRWAYRQVCAARDRREFADRFVDVDRAFTQARDSGVSRVATTFRPVEYRRPLGVAWGEYKETMVLPNTGSEDVVRNSLRPSVFFDAEDLGFHPGWWRVWPGLFVSIGLLLTFLGLIAALNAIGGDEITDDSLRELLNAASAKFIMSLTGLACSIGVTMVGRLSTSGVETGIRRLCHALEKRLHFYSLEEIAEAQLVATREQGTAMRQVATEMVAELSRPLKEDLPQAIGASIKAEMAPLLNSLSQTSEQGLGQMVGDLSQRVTRDIGEAMGEAGRQLGAVADRLAGLSERMESGTSRIGQEYETLAARMGAQMTNLQAAMQREVASGQQAMSDSIERMMSQMTDSLEAIRTNTSQGAQAIADAAADMRAAAEGFREELARATGDGASAVETRMQSAAVTAGDAIAAATSGLTGPLAQLAERLEAAAEQTRDGAAGLSRLAEAARGGGDAIARGSDRFERAAVVMTEAAEPIRVGIDGLRGATRDVADEMRAAMDTSLAQSRTTAEQTREALQAATAILTAKRTGIKDAMEGLAVALAELKGHGDRLDDIDRKLGRAFETYREQVEATMSGTAEQVNKIVETLEPALSTMQAVVEQAEEFAPQSRPNGGRR